MADPAIRIDGLVKRFAAGERSVTALEGVTATVAPGQVTGLVGPDGAGKTTLMRMIGGLLRPDDGHISVFGLDSVGEAHEIQSMIGYMPQRFGLYEDLTVGENLHLYADLQGVARVDREDRFAGLMRFTGLDPFVGRLAGKLSGGMKQKLGLACVLVHPPRLLLLDEPSVGVDPVSRRELWSMVYALVDRGVSVLWSTAYLDEAERCREVLLLREGRLIAAGRPGEFAARLAGRVYVASGGGDKRRLVAALGRRPEVRDAVLKGANVRLLLATPPTPRELEDLGRELAGPGASPAVLKPMSPQFEEAFIDLVREPPDAAADAGAAPEVEAAPPAAGDAADDMVIEVSGLVRRFGDFRAVDGIDFTVGRGEIFGLLGPNGAGKSTTFKMLCGLLPPSEGKALVLGIDLGRAAAVARRKIGYMAQKFSLYGNLSVIQNLRFYAGAYGLGGRRRKARTAWALDEFGLGAEADTISDTLPLGFKQRLSLACALLHEPGVLFLDEPTSGVDPLVRREFWARINAMAAAGVTVVVTTHFMEEAEYCDRIGIIYRGRLVALGPPRQIEDEHRTPELPEPTLEDAFVAIVERFEREEAA